MSERGRDRWRALQVALLLVGAVGMAAFTAAVTAAASSEPSPVSYVPAGPARLLETRGGPGLATVDGAYDGIGQRPAGSTTELPIAGRAGVSEGAAAAALTITAVDASAPGFVTAHPCDQPRPNAASLTHDGAATVSNLVIAGIGRAGNVCIFTLAKTDLTVDVVGYYPSGGIEPVGPSRLLESRAGANMATVDGAWAAVGILGAGSDLVLPVAGRGGIPDGATAAALNVTVVDPSAAGFVTVYPCDRERPNAATLAHAAGTTRSAAMVTALATDGTVCVFTLAAVHLTVDVAAFHSSGNWPASTRAGDVSDGTPKALMIGDSTLAALAWYPSSQEPLHGMDYVLEAESCRAVTARSCLGRPNPVTGLRSRPDNALTVLQSYPSGSIDELVLMVGYDEALSTFQQSVPAMLAAARAAGVRHVTWLTFPTGVNYVPPGETRADSSTYSWYNLVLAHHAGISGGFMSLVDWSGQVAASAGLVEADGIHLTFAGARRVAELIRNAAQAQWSQPPWPARLLETRVGTGLGTIDGVGNGGGIRRADTVTVLPIVGRAGIPEDIAAVIMSLTVVDAAADGFVTVHPCGASRPNAASVAFTMGSTVSIGVIAALGPSRTVCLYTMTDVDLVVDVSGYYRHVDT